MTYPNQQYPAQPGYGYPPAQPQMPPAQYYPPQNPGYPPQQVGGYPMPPQAPPPPPQRATGTLSSFANQRSGGFGKGVNFPQIGHAVVMRVARDITDADTQQMTKYKSTELAFNSDGSPKLQLVIPVVLVPGVSPDHPTGAGTHYVKPGDQRDKMLAAVRAVYGPDSDGFPRAGDVLFCRLAGKRQSGQGAAANVWEYQLTPADQVDAVWGPQAPPMEPLMDTGVQYAQPQQYQQAPAPYTPAPGMPGYQPVAPQQAPPAAPTQAMPAQQYQPAPQPPQLPQQPQASAQPAQQPQNPAMPPPLAGDPAAVMAQLTGHPQPQQG